MANGTKKKQQGETMCFILGESETRESSPTTEALILFKYKRNGKYTLYLINQNSLFICWGC